MNSNRAQVGVASDRASVVAPESASTEDRSVVLTLAAHSISSNIQSSARVLQTELSARLREEGAPKWTGRSTMFFIVGTCGAFWGLVMWGVSLVLNK